MVRFFNDKLLTSEYIKDVGECVNSFVNSRNRIRARVRGVKTETSILQYETQRSHDERGRVIKVLGGNRIV